ncbi:hypothetical protein PVAND_010586 [Polypedilum vanderplanki]|uniref:SHSP domain-containing protein n=1 Tax=Polypedilum vanderplanki TaxID=319348 RepID=A0A9J6CHR3_POLVA|nr:hypothetical protein PVAND_010586 [Polypedilum vanderplanki]
MQDNCFEINLDVQRCKREDISVELQDNCIVVTTKKCNPDDNSIVARKFSKRTYPLNILQKYDKESLRYEFDKNDASIKPVSVRNKTIGQLVTSSLLTWESFNEKDAHAQFEYAVYGGEFIATKDKAYICRASINTALVTGYVLKREDNKKYVCIISQHKIIKTKGDFDLLLNKGNGAKLKWVLFEKMSVFQNIDGAVSTINGGSTEIYYIARHNHSMEHHEIDHAIGWFDPKDGFGKIHAMIQNEERIFEDGEILVAIEAVRYELHDMKFKRLKLQEKKERKLLGQTILKNEGDEEIDVKAVIGYEYEIERNLGTHEGIARSINTTVFVTNRDTFNFLWGIKKTDHILSSKNVGTILKPGTAINVTLWGNYTIKEGPYDATLIVHWADGTNSKKRKITVASGYEADLEDPLEIEESATYWLLNNTIVPTTTQRTTSTSSSTTNKSIFSTSVANNAIEKITPKTVMELNAASKSDAMNDDTENEINNSPTNGSSKGFVFSILATIILTLTSFLLTTY